MADLPLLISVQDLNAHLEGSGDRIIVVDATVLLTLDPQGGPPTIESGRAGYERAHVPGAIFVDVLALSDPDTDLPFMLPDAEHFSQFLSALGISEGSQIVVYDTVTGMWATRLWWMLTAFGAQKVSVLDGGFTAWQAADLASSDRASVLRPVEFRAEFQPNLVADRSQVADAIGGATCLVNALPAPLFTGEVPSTPGRSGHIPGSVSTPYDSLTDPETNRFLPDEQLRERFSEAGVLGHDEIVTYCGGGIAATYAAFALALLGRSDVAVYDGSMVDWNSDPKSPLDTVG